MSRDARHSGEAHAADPRDLRHVGPATAAAIDRAPFDAADLLNRTVSLRDLLAAGVNPGVAARLRREYSLVWSFEWLAGADLASRASQVGGLGPRQREWIAESAPAGARADDDLATTEAERAWQARSAWLSASDAPDHRCGRCDEPLVTYRLAARRAVRCEACGYVGVEVR